MGLRGIKIKLIISANFKVNNTKSRNMQDRIEVDNKRIELIII